MQLNTYLAFNGNCEQALTFYADIFDGKLELMRFRDAPPCEGMDAPPPDQIMHGCVTVGDYSLMGTDAMMSGPFQPITGAHVVINVDAVDKAEELFAALSRGRPDIHADGKDVLGGALRYLHRPFWHAVDDQLHSPGLTLAMDCTAHRWA